MYLVHVPCPRCAVEHTMRLSDGRPFCINCLLHRRSTSVDTSAGRSASLSPASRFEYPPGSAT
jgi:hypothetical protein